MKVQENIALAPLTTLEVGGAARFFVKVTTEEEIFDALHFVEINNLPVFVLGGGSNLLISDKGFDGMVVQIALKGIEFSSGENGGVFVTAAAGENWDEFVKICVERNLAGIECLSGIPGTTGATPIQNVGAYGQEVSETIVAVRVFDCLSRKTKTFTNAECGFAYRTSVFNTIHKNRYIVLSVTFRLELNGRPALRYKDLQKIFAEHKDEPTLTETREAVVQIRAAKSMVIWETDENRRSAGSFFKNPVVSKSKFDEIEQITRRLNLIDEAQKMPHFTADDNKIKIPAAWLIEQSGFAKGFGDGRVGLSTRHTLAIVNRGGATANEIVSFMRQIQTRVEEVFGILLQPEPIFIGFEK